MELQCENNNVPVIQPYLRRVHYYETDGMGIVHHSNYIRWFEEARVDLMEQAGYGYAALEREGISSPVLGLSCEYKGMVRFGQSVHVLAVIEAFTGAKMTIKYRVELADTGELCTTGESRHCFLNRAGRPVSMKKENPEVYTRFLAMVRNPR